jgi:hypothetical protein
MDEMTREQAAQALYRRIKENPGISRDRLMDEFGYTDYKLKRAFRLMARGVDGWILVDDSDHGLWIIRQDHDHCLAAIWSDEDEGFFTQCTATPCFPDNRCYEHSLWENAAMTAFERRLSYLAGPRNPTPYSVGQLTIHEIDSLMGDLFDIVPKTRIQRQAWTGRASLLKSARAFAVWRDNLRAREGQERDWMDPRLHQRHNRSSVNPFEFSLNKHFAVLEVAPRATKDEVLQAWRRLARKYHPDREGGDEEAMKAVNLAKERIFRIRRWDKEPRSRGQ